ncbi:MAG: hypothetical protein LC623_00840 [Halobacteriales archaeon]|nr:hypothetical protein [Halobacteriales archaeon]
MPENTMMVVNQSTTIRADRVQILGVLLTDDARAGDAPTLCIETTQLEITGTLCTGRGLDGDTAIGPTAQGTAGTNGGNLIIRLVANDTTAPLAPVLTGHVCTGDGGDGGPALGTPGTQMTVLDTKQLTRVYTLCQNAIERARNPVKNLDQAIDSESPPSDIYLSIETQACTPLMTVQDVLQDPQGYVCGFSPEVENLAVVCDPIDTSPNLDDLPGLDDLPPAPELCELPGMSLVPVACGPLPDECSLPGVEELPVFCKPMPCVTWSCLVPFLDCTEPSGCVPPVPTCYSITHYPNCTPSCQDVTHTSNCVPDTGPLEEFVWEGADLVLRLVTNVCPIGTDLTQPCGVPLCDSPNTQAMALGGSGGAGGVLSFSLPPELAATLPTNSFWPGDGGDGGNAVAFGDARFVSVQAYGGSGGASTALLNGSPFADVEALGSGSGGTGGMGFAMGNSVSGLKCSGPCSIEDPLSCYFPCPGLNIDQIECIGIWLINQGTGAPGSDQEKTGLPGDPGTNGAPGDEALYTYQFAWSPPFYDCSVLQSATPGGDGGGGARLSGHSVDAQGGPGDKGPVVGGRGGNAHATAAAGMDGGMGGRGGDGYDRSVWSECPDTYCAPGGAGGYGGDSSPGSATGGQGGDGRVRNGDGGDATVEQAIGGAGGSGGDGGEQLHTPIWETIQCYGGCGGWGGITSEMIPTRGEPGTGTALQPGNPGTATATGPAYGTRSPQGLDGQSGHDCPKQP